MSDHQPVLVDEVLEGLSPVSDGWYVDATYGRGGHCTAILARLGANGRLLAFDKDPDAVADAKQRFAAESRLEICHADFAAMAQSLRSVLARIGQTEFCSTSVCHRHSSMSPSVVSASWRTARSICV